MLHFQLLQRKAWFIPGKSSSLAHKQHLTQSWLTICSETFVEGSWKSPSICTGTCLLPSTDLLGVFFSPQNIHHVESLCIQGLESYLWRPYEIVCFFSHGIDLRNHRKVNVFSYGSVLRFTCEEISVFIMKSSISMVPEKLSLHRCLVIQAVPQLGSRGRLLFHSQVVLRETTVLGS